MHHFWHRAPLARIALLFILGLLAGKILPTTGVSLYLLLGFLILGTALIIAFRKRLKYKRYSYFSGGALAFLIFLAGAGRGLQADLRLKERLALPPLGKSYQAIVENGPEYMERTVKFRIAIIAVQGAEADSMKFHPKVLAYCPIDQFDSTLTTGQVISFISQPRKVEPPINPNQFNYGKYLANKGIAGTVYLNDGFRVVDRKEADTGILNFFQGLNYKASEIFNSYSIPADQIGVINALVLGKKNTLDPEVSESFANAGVVHVLAVSGLHVGIIYLVIYALFSGIFPSKRYRWLRFGLTVFLLWLYAGITGFSPSVLRAATMFSFIALGKEMKLKGNIYNMLAASALLLCILNPNIIMQVGFQLSYIAVIGIVALFKPIYGLLYFKHWLPDKIWSLTVVSFAAQVATAPVSIYYFGQFPNLFFLSNLVVIPLATVSLYGGLALLALHWVPVLDTAIAAVLKGLLWLLVQFVALISEVPHSISDGLYLGTAAMLIFYLLYLAIGVFLANPGRWRLPLISVLVLSVLWSFKKINKAREQSIAVLEGSGGPILGLRSGENFYAIVADTSHDALEKEAFYTEGYLDKERIENPIWLEYQSIYYDQRLHLEGRTAVFGGRRIQIVADSQEAVNTELLLVTNDAQVLPSSLKAKMVVLASDIPLSRIENFKEKLTALDVPYTSIKDDGIFYERVEGRNYTLKYP